MDENDLVEVLSAWLAPIIAIVGLMLGSLQYWLALKKRKDDLFDRRYAYYQKVRNMWVSTWDKDQPVFDQEDVIMLAEEAGFIFGKDICEHILSLENKRHGGSPFFPDEDFVKPFRKYLELK